MKIRTDAWHYRVFMWSHLVPADSWGYKTSLCPYFWRVMLAMLWLPPVTLICLLGKIYNIPRILLEDGLKEFSLRKFHPFVAVDCRSNPLFEAIQGILYSFVILILGLKALSHWMVVCLIICCAVLVASALIVVGVGLNASYKKYKEYKTEKSGDSIFFQYLSAAKQKVCPKIEFVDKD